MAESRWRSRLYHALFDIAPDTDMSPLQARVTVLAVYTVGLAGVLGVAVNIARDYAAGNYIVVVVLAVFLTCILAGLAMFLVTRSLTPPRVCYAAGILVLVAGLIYSAGGTRGFGLFYIMTGYSVLYFILGLRGSLAVPLLVLIGSSLRIQLGQFPPESFLHDPDFTASYQFVVWVSAVLGMATILAQHLLITYLSNIAYRDELTGLANRNRYELLIPRLAARYNLGHPGFAIIGIKLLQFARVNSFRGARFADDLIALTAERIRQAANSEDVIVRYTGTVFFVVTAAAAVDQLEQQAQNILAAVQKPVHHTGKTLSLQGVVTITLFPQDGLSIEHLTGNLMSGFSRRRSKPGTVSFYDETQHRVEARRFVMIEELRSAIRREELRLVFHPKVNLQDNRCHGAEILLRWYNPVFGEVEPGVFIPLAEEAGVIREITRWVAETTVHSLQHLLSSLPARAQQLIHAINLSPMDLSDPGFCEFLTALLHRNPLDPRSLEFEITEGVMMDQSAEIQHTLAYLRSKGYRIAIDDFGTGYSSLSYLHQIQAQNLKIDREFIRQITGPEAHSPVVDAIISMAGSLQLDITAEGVEYQYQADYLTARGCTYAQGWLYSQPLALDDYINWLRSRAGCMHA
ncbi:putative bifunctional diguanylate cyclase/phosphodiesterase [Spirochaeta africana]|uniref:Diguanylate cyclase (GGDEF) domain-containing protein n=1 Tax=Spirochaeta africana (strain ATCC 700263 / DSM 8902 / Z-7692) TaxID=889378 RepID=H9UHT5_SPIAZ|nr:bifunctional diguanylate cyclase/phosphodiesterase [Spirochaeta africana]AFG37078.1 diguanylate cyclase (GGDEF) domain-containing protein [Spirochaeta africana DSM 8902]